jgi:hypothetical protein
VTGDDGNPSVLAAGAQAGIRHMQSDVAVALGGTERAYSATVNGPVAAAASPATCRSFSSTSYQVPVALNPGALSPASTG